MVRFVLLGMIALASTAVDDPAGLAEEKARHQGAWAVERSVRGGKDGPAEVLKEIVREVKGDRVVWKRGDSSFAATKFEIDPEAEPKTIDLIPEGGQNRGERVLGIYKFEDDRLVLCVADPGKPRPLEFGSEPGDGQTWMTFRKVEPSGEKDGSGTCSGGDRGGQ